MMFIFVEAIDDNVNFRDYVLKLHKVSWVSILQPLEANNQLICILIAYFLESKWGFEEVSRLN